MINPEALASMLGIDPKQAQAARDFLAPDNLQHLQNRLDDADSRTKLSIRKLNDLTTRQLAATLQGANERAELKLQGQETQALLRQVLVLLGGVE